jgi:aryl-alcohol dehydrogenase-like predicted oxidoreductase
MACGRKPLCASASSRCVAPGFIMASMTVPSIAARRRLGRTGPEVFPLGLGCMAMSGAYGAADRAESIATVHAALEGGVRLIDTADFYAMGHNELLLAEALREVPRERLRISVKFGSLRDVDGNWLGSDGRPVAVKTFLAYTLRRLNTDYVDFYRLGRVDPAVPIEDTVGAISEMIAKGHVRHVGLSEAGPQTVRRAHAVHPVADLQIEYSLFSRGIEAAILPACRELGVGVTAYGVLSRGVLSGHWTPQRATAAGDMRAFMPRYRADNLRDNLRLVEALRAIAAARGATVAQLAFAWVLSRGTDIVPLIGARRREQLTESLGSLALSLEAEEITAIERAAPVGAVAGSRYPDPVLAELDSERSIR